MRSGRRPALSIPGPRATRSLTLKLPQDPTIETPRNPYPGHRASPAKGEQEVRAPHKHLTALLISLLVGMALGQQVIDGVLETSDTANDTGHYFDFYPLEVLPNQQLTIELTSPDFNTFLILQPPTGEPISNDDYLGSTSRSKLQIASPEAGSWIVWVTSFEPGDTGGYQLTISKTPATPLGGTSEPTNPLSSLEDEALDLLSLGVDYYQQDRYHEALDVLEKALEIFQGEGLRQLEGTTLLTIGAVYANLGQPDQALNYYQQALSTYQETGDRSGQAVTLNNIGIVYDNLGQAERAVTFYERVLAIDRETSNRRGEATTLNNIGAVYDDLGRFDQALNYYQQALPIRRETGDRRGEAATLNNIGLIFADLGQFDQALNYYQQALPITQETGDRRGEASALNNIGAVYDDLGRFDQALNYYQQALPIRRETGDRRGEAATLNNIGLIFADLGQFDQALNYYQQALPITQETGDRRGEASALNNIGFVYGNLGQPDQALAFLQQALPIRRETGDRQGEANTLSSIGLVYEIQGNPEAALKHYQQATQLQEDVRSLQWLDTTKTQITQQTVPVFQRAITLAIQLQQYELAFELSEQARARNFLDQLGNNLPNLTQGADPTLAEEIKNLRNQIAGLEQAKNNEYAKPVTERNQRLINDLLAQIDDKQQQYTQTLDLLKLQSPEYAALITTNPLTLSEVQELLQPQQTILSYFTTQDTTYAFIITREQFNVIQLNVTQQQLEHSITTFRNFPNTQPQHLEQTRQPLADLYGELIQPLLDQGYLRPQQTRLLTIIPHGILHYLPFNAFWNPNTNTYLVDTYTTNYLPSASVLRFTTEKSQGNPNNNQLLAMANPTAQGLPTLIHATQEVRSVTNLYGTTPLTNQNATETNFNTLSQDSDILFLAAHGQLNQQNPLFTRIVLAPDQQNDGSLTVEEVYDLDLSNTNLVFLSACQTTLGGSDQGDDFIGLNRAFIYAGTPTIIASLWNVDDQATQILTTTFFDHLHNGTSPAQALQRAQQTVRNNPNYTHPYYWAAFILTGQAGTTSAEEALEELPSLGITAVRPPFRPRNVLPMSDRPSYRLLGEARRARWDRVFAATG